MKKAKNRFLFCKYIFLTATIFFPILLVFGESDALWRSYRMEYTFSNHLDNSSKIWMPVPRFWDGNGVISIEIVEISPAPTDRYNCLNGTGTEITFWETSGNPAQEFKIVFDITLSSIDHNINESQAWPPYDTNSELYINNTASTSWAESDHQDIMAQAEMIVGNETNPYKQTKLLHAWVSDSDNIGRSLPGDRFPGTALTTLQNKRSDCAGHSNLFVAFCRSRGIPARNIIGLHPPESNQFANGLYYWPDFGTHVWAEFYLPTYGWVQCDPSRLAYFPLIPDERVVLSKGNDIVLGHGYSCDDHNAINGVRSYFHLPQAPCQSGAGGALWLKVEYLGSGGEDGGDDGGGGGTGGCLIGTTAYGSLR